MNKKKIGVVTCIALLVAFGVTMFAVGGAQEEDASADVATVTKDGKEITVDKEGNEVKITKDGEVEIVKEDVVSKSEATKAVEKSNYSNVAKSNSSSKSNVSKNDSHKNNNSSPAKASNSSSNKHNDSGNTPAKPSTPTKPAKPAPSKPAEPTKPAHSHSWTPVYATKQVQVGTDSRCVDSVIVCNTCGYRGVTIEHKNMHIDAGQPSSTHVDEIYEDVPIYETQKYVSYYKCSCGATK